MSAWLVDRSTRKLAGLVQGAHQVSLVLIRYRQVKKRKCGVWLVHFIQMQLMCDKQFFLTVIRIKL